MQLLFGITRTREGEKMGGNNNPTGRNQFSLRGTQSWLKVRFKTHVCDFQPLGTPPGPYWRTGGTYDYSIVTAYVKKLSQVEHLWPEADDIEHMGAFAEIEFSERLPKPAWWKT